MNSSHRAVVVMARAPRGPRAPKSRLASILPSETSRRRLYTAFLNDTMQPCRKTGAVVRVAYTTSGGTRGFAEAGIRPDELVPQRGDDLGARERGVFEDLFADGLSPVVMIGSDLPTLPISVVRTALRRLSRQPDQVVLGPAEDGGYYLMGLAGDTDSVLPDLFRDIRWSTNHTLDDTVKAADAAGLAASYVDRWYDVDDEMGLARLRKDLTTAAYASRSPATKLALDELFPKPKS